MGPLVYMCFWRHVRFSSISNTSISDQPCSLWKLFCWFFNYPTSWAPIAHLRKRASRFQFLRCSSTQTCVSISIFALLIYANLRLDLNFRVALSTSRCTVFSSRQRRNCVVRRSVFFFLTDEELRRPLAVLRCHVYIHRRRRASPSWSERFQIVDHERVRTFQTYLPELHIICLKKQHVQINKLIVNIFLKKFANIRILRNRFKKYRKKIN